MIERRFVKGAEIRAKDDGHIDGHAAVFNEEYVLWDSESYRVVEKVKPGTFTRALKEKHDVRCLFNHDANQLLGRTAAGTLSLKQDAQGLYFDCEPPDTTLGRDVVTLVKRGDITGASFAFSVTKQTVTEEENNGKTVRTRVIEDVDLYDASPVTYPAYTGTDVNARMLEMRGAMFPAGVPPAVLELVPDLRASNSQNDEDQACRCGCRACKSAECDECELHMARCGDKSFCDHSGTRSARDGKPTKRVDGEDLTSGCFIYVGDAAKPATWALPWKFSTDAKTKSHLRNALARFNQTQKIPADKKAAVWKKLVRLCKKNGVTVSDEESKGLNLTAEQRAQLAPPDKARGSVGAGEDCECSCPECQVGDCENCSEDGCEDPHCDHTSDDAGTENDGADLEHVEGRLRDLGLPLEP
jgi:HK97 family phage prohead protease